MAASGISFEAPAWAKVVNRYKNAAEKVGLVQRGIILWAQTEAVKEARHQIDTLVYQAPISASGYQRTGAARRAISVKGAISWVPGQAAWGVVHVDRAIANRQGFYYPAILNRGRTDVRYYPRPFWTATRALMQVRYERQGRVALRQLHQQLSVG